ncbi:MAG: sugar ABC transporter substrate-binding protein [Candidatus Melainabacteria bacterium]
MISIPLQLLSGVYPGAGLRRGGLGLLLACLLLLPGCGGSSAPEGRTVIRLSTWGTAEEMGVLKDLLHRFEAKNPDVAVDVIHIPENYYQKLHILVAGGLAPDVIFTNSIQFPVYARHGVFRDLTPFLNHTSELSRTDFYEGALKAFTWHNAQGEPSLQAIPRDISNLVVYYNKSLFQAGSIPLPKTGWTWDDFLDTAQAVMLANKQGGRMPVFGVSFSREPLYWMPFVWSAGGDFFSGDYSRFALDEPRALEALRYYADLRTKYHVAPRQNESGGIPMSQLFLNGKLGMLIDGRWRVPIFREQATFDWDVAPLPVGPSGESRVGIDASGYAMSSGTTHPEESFRLIRFLSSAKANARFAASGLIVPARKDVATSEDFLSPGRRPVHSSVFLDVIEFGVPTRTPPRWNEISEVVKLALDKVWEGADTPAEALQPVAPAVNRILDRSRER